PPPHPTPPLFPYTTLFRSCPRYLARQQSLGRGGGSCSRHRGCGWSRSWAAKIEVHVRCPLRSRLSVKEGPRREAEHSGKQSCGEDRKSTRLNSSHVKISYA